MTPGSDHRSFDHGGRKKRIFPHQFSWLLNNPVRRLLLSPKRFAESLDLSASSRVCELGPGSGFLSHELARRVPKGELVLVDRQPEMLSKARRKLDGAGCRNVRYIVADASGELACPDGHFDVAVLVCVLGEISNPKACLRTLNRIVRPGGKLAIHESIPDPDRIDIGRLRTLVEEEEFAFHRQDGPAWNYTAFFERA